MKAKAKKQKKQVISIVLPGDVLDFYKSVGKFADCTAQQAILVVLALDVINREKLK